MIPFTKYDAYLRSDRWKKTRAHILKIEPNCEICWTKTKLEVHHISYFNLGNETKKDLIVLCNDCHETTHRYHNKLKKKGWTTIPLV